MFLQVSTIERSKNTKINHNKLPIQNRVSNNQKKVNQMINKKPVNLADKYY